MVVTKVIDPLTFDGDGETPLTHDDRAGLRPAWIATRADLNEAEQEAITGAALAWHRRGLTIADLLDDAMLRRLHLDMFGPVWTWAGKYRNSELNIGVAPERVAVSVRNLCANAALWLSGAEPHGVKVDLARLHHQLVLIHPFANGNGRHARLLVDLCAARGGVDAPSWGRDVAGYLAALRRADRDHDDLAALTSFMWGSRSCP